MLNTKVDTHNIRTKELERAIAEFQAKLAEELQKGDALKAEEIKAYADINGVKQVWLWEDEHYAKVYVGEFFDFSGGHPLESRGTYNGRAMKKELQAMATLRTETKIVPWGDHDAKLLEILVVTFP